MKLALLFTHGVSLEQWVKSGIFFREKSIYEKHIKEKIIKKIYFITYGINDYKVSIELKNKGLLNKNITILGMPYLFSKIIFGKKIYSLLIPFIFYNKIKQIDILKTNQFSGLPTVFIVKTFFSKIIYSRCGFLNSRFYIKLHKKSFIKKYFIFFIEKFICRYSTHIAVSSKSDAKFLIKKYNILNKKIMILPNYIDTKIFNNKRKINFNNKKLLFVGRFSKQKNLENLIIAISKKNIQLDLLGSGPLKSKLQNLSNQIKSNVNFLNIIPNNKLPKIYKKYNYFILPSIIEGTPKSLLEAMACGLITISTDVEGINEIIVNNSNGFLIKNLDSKSILRGINYAYKKSNIKISKKATLTVMNKFTLELFFKKEKELFKLLIKI